MTHDDAVRAAARARGAVLATLAHVLLLLAVLGEVVFLASRYRLRVDGTADRLYSLTDSTRQLVGALDKRLLIEAYFSPKSELPSQLRDTRTVLENFLDELVQLGQGKVVVQRFDPNHDKVVTDKCTRLGIKPIEARSASTTSIQLAKHWQGLRLVYGGGKQKVIEQIMPVTSFLAEATVTPGIKEVVTKTKKRIGYMEWPSAPQPGQQTPQGNGWNLVRSMDEVARRYEFQNFRDSEGALLPADVDTLLLFHPNDLSDRQKYVIDQFLVRGGTLVVFAEAAEYAIGPRRTFSKSGGGLDAKDSEWKFQEQMLHYGVDLRGMVVADLAQDAQRPQNQLLAPYEYFALVNPGRMGMGWLPYPYFFHAVNGDWAKVADQLATNQATGQKDEALADEYRKRFRPGIDSSEFLFQAFKQFGRGPGFYWPCWTDLRRKNGAADLPAGVEGNVLLWSSPLGFAEDPPASLDPVGGGDRNSQLAQFQAFQQKFAQRMQSEPRQQAPLMVDLRGTFTSFFAGKPRPKKASEIAEETAKKKEQEAKEQAAKEQGEAGKDAAAAKEQPAKDQPVKDQPVKQAAKEEVPPQAPRQPATSRPAGGGDELEPEAEDAADGTAPWLDRDAAQEPTRQEPAKQEPAKQEPAKPAPGKQEPVKQGPPPPPGLGSDASKAPKTPEPEPLLQGTAPGHLCVIGDSDFVRDDFVRGDYANLGGPVSLTGKSFFLMLIDWLNQDKDLLALQTRVPVDRRLELVQSAPGKVVDPVEAEQALRRKINWLTGLNVAVPCAALLVLGLFVGLSRRAQKRAFLSSIGE